MFWLNNTYIPTTGYRELLSRYLSELLIKTWSLFLDSMTAYASLLPASPQQHRRQRYRTTQHAFTTYTTLTLLEHRAFTQWTPPAIGAPLMRDPDWVSKYASVVPRPRVWASRQTAHGSTLTNQIAHNHMVNESGCHWQTIQVDVIQVHACGHWIVP